MYIYIPYTLTSSQPLDAPTVFSQGGEGDLQGRRGPAGGKGCGPGLRNDQQAVIVYEYWFIIIGY